MPFVCRPPFIYVFIAWLFQWLIATDAIEKKEFQDAIHLVSLVKQQLQEQFLFMLLLTFYSHLKHLIILRL